MSEVSVDEPTFLKPLKAGRKKTQILVTGVEENWTNSLLIVNTIITHNVTWFPQKNEGINTEQQNDPVATLLHQKCLAGRI